MSERVFGVAVLAVVLVMAVGSGAVAAPLDATTSLNGGVNAIPLAVGTQNVDDNASNVYDWNDKDGNGATGDFVTPAGMDMAGFSLTTNDGSNIKLDLNGGGITGDSGVTAILTYRGPGNSLHSGSVTISNVGTVGLGTIDTHTSGGSSTGGSAHAGDVAIGSSGTPAGPVRVDAILAMAGMNRPGSATGQGGDVTIHSSGDVRIENAAGTLRGDIRTDHWSAYRAGNVNIQHEGSFRANDITAYTVINWSSAKSAPGNVTLNGDLLGGGPSGDLELHSIRAGRLQHYGYAPTAGNLISIQGYTDVRITGDVDTAQNDTTGTGQAGGLTISGITGAIDIDGTIDLNNAAGDAQDGALSLACEGPISLASLNLDRVKSAELDALGHSTVIGSLAGLGLTNSGGSGTYADPYILTQTKLRVPDGQYLFYNYEAGVLNDYLGGSVYQLADLSPAAGVGGLLLTEISGGAMIPEPAALGLLGLAALGLRRRRR